MIINLEGSKKNPDIKILNLWLNVNAPTKWKYFHKFVLSSQFLSSPFQSFRIFFKSFFFTKHSSLIEKNLPSVQEQIVKWQQFRNNSLSPTPLPSVHKFHFSHSFTIINLATWRVNSNSSVEKYSKEKSGILHRHSVNYRSLKLRSLPSHPNNTTKSINNKSSSWLLSDKTIKLLKHTAE